MAKNKEEEPVKTAFNAKIADAKVLKSIVGAIKIVTDEALLTVGDEGISTKCIDPSNTFMVDLKVASGIFAEYSATNGKLGVDIAKLDNRISKMSGETVLELLEETRSLAITSGKLHHEIQLLDPSAVRKEPKLPPLGDGYAWPKIPGSTFDEAIDASKDVGTMPTFNIVDGKLFMESLGDTDKVTYEMAEGVEGTSKTMLSIEYLQDIAKVVKALPEITLGLRTDYPLIVDFAIVDGVEARYVLAPRVENND